MSEIGGRTSPLLWDKKNIHPFIPAKRLIAFKVSGIGAKVLTGPELSGIHKNTDHQRIGHALGQSHERQVAFVKIAHRRNERDGFSLISQMI